MKIFFPDGSVVDVGAGQTPAYRPASSSSPPTIDLLLGGVWFSFSCTDALEQALFMTQVNAAILAGATSLVLLTRTAASVVSLAPATGPAAGGTTLVITGTGFRQIGSVTIGGAAVSNYNYISGTSLLVVSPAGTLGARDVVYTDDRGSTTLVGGFTYV